VSSNSGDSLETSWGLLREPSTSK